MLLQYLFSFLKLQFFIIHHSIRLSCDRRFLLNLRLFFIFPSFQYRLLFVFILKVFIDRIFLILLDPFNFLVVKLCFNAIIPFHIVIQIQYRWKTHTLRNFYPLECFVIKSKSIQTETHNFGALRKLQTFQGINFFVALGAFILVVSVKNIGFEIVFNCHFQAGVDHACAKFVLDRQLYILILITSI